MLAYASDIPLVAASEMGRAQTEHHFLVLSYTCDMWTVYILQHSENKTFYVGFTNNLKRRLQQHNTNKNYSTRRKSGEWILVYAEGYRNKQDAVTRELKLKQRGRSKQELLKRIKSSLIV